MSGWIKFEKDLETDPRFIRLRRNVRASLLQVTHERDASVTHVTQGRDMVVSPLTDGNVLSALTAGLLCRFWCYVDTHIRQDDTLDLSFEDLDELVGLPGFAEAMPEDWLQRIDDATVLVPGYQEHNGVEARKRDLAAKRKDRQRARERATPVTPVRDASVTPVTQVRDQTRPDQTRPGKTPPDSSPSATPAKPKAKPPPIDWAAIEGLDLEAWELWLAFRRRLKVKPYVTDQKARELARYPAAIQRAAVDHSISNQYQGLFPGRINPHEATRDGDRLRTRFEQHTAKLANWLGSG